MTFEDMLNDEPYKSCYQKGFADGEAKGRADAARWIPVTERLPETTDAVNIVWVNHNPPPYYSNIKDKPFSATGHYFKGNWYWYSSVCKDFLNEYGKNDIDLIDNDIEITHWMPLPQPYKKEGAEEWQNG